MGLDYDQLFPGRFLKAGEFQGQQVTLTITDVTTEELPQERGDNRVRGIIHFAQTPKALVLCRTNGECLKALWGRNCDDWIGQRVTLYPASIQCGIPGVDTAIRVAGAPHLEEPLSVTIRLPRRKPFEMTLRPTGKPKPEPVVETTEDELP